jgi:hypothetical protein
VEVDQRSANNRLIYLLENVFHANLVIKALETFNYHDFTNVYLKSHLLDQVHSFKLFLAGNLTPEESHHALCVVTDSLKLDSISVKLGSICETKTHVKHV